MRTSAFMAGEDFVRLRRQIAKIEANAWVKVRDEPASVAPTDPLPPSPFQGEETGGREEMHRVHKLGRTPPPERGRMGGSHSSPHHPQENFTRASPSLAPRRDREPIRFAIPQFDQLLAGGLRRNALHEMRCNESRDAAAMTGFATAVLASLAAKDDRPILWIAETAATDEAGLPYGVGLAAFGLDPSRLVIVRVAKPQDALWVFEEGLRCRGLAAVLTELRGNPRQLDLTASRRLALRAAAHGVMGLLLRQSNRALPSSAHTRWLVAPRPASVDDDYPEGIGHPAWRLTLERNRQGSPGTFDVEWDHDRRCFAPAKTIVAAHPRPLPSLPVDRPAASPDVWKIVALAPRKELLPREEKRRRQWARG